MIGSEGMFGIGLAVGIDASPLHASVREGEARQETPVDRLIAGQVSVGAATPGLAIEAPQPKWRGACERKSANSRTC